MLCGISYLPYPWMYGHVLLPVPVDENAEINCNLLREAGLMYSVYTAYGEADLKYIQIDDLFCDMRYDPGALCSRVHPRSSECYRT